ncbi:DUF6517 family protein [Natronobacterium texcoconense]|uniref:Uncharacterized protein n=1 Tax=Natronobacterium texcoconense TaxID=1095778 RepID=A0A1H1IUY5_NATTX|nr:DUF6517 family protein [Natronobacterium texcoconense]SDR41517.1 hypothetical protein SAMN04489842_3803 [Natronobacterium texcoconense]
MYRRSFVATVVATGAVASAGCLGDVLEDVTTHSASPAVVADAATDETAYEYRGTEETVRTETVAGESIEATNYISEYVRTIDLPIDAFDAETEAGVFGLVTTPRVSVAGEEFNPVGELSHAEIAEHVQDQYGDLAVDDEPIDRRTRETLGQSITVDSFEGEATLLEDRRVDVYVDVSQPDHDGDHLVITGVYPDVDGLEREAERDRIDALIDGIEHGDDVDVELES